MARKDLEHAALVLRRQVEERIPGDQPVEAAAKGEAAHVGDLPVAFGKAGPAQRDHRRGGIDTGDGMAVFDEMAGDRLPGAAADIEDRGAGREQVPETREPRAFHQRLAAQAVIGGGVALVEIDDGIGGRGHGAVRCPAALPRNPALASFRVGTAWWAP